ncbi:cytochrome P450 4V2 [Ixodes scapularis]
MDPELEVTAKIFNYFEGMFKTIEDNEVTVAYYGPQPFFIATTPTAIEPILNNTQNLNKAFLYNMMKPWIGNGILMIEKTGWRMRRKILTPAFHFRILDDYAPIMNRRAEQMVHKLCLVKEGYFDVLPIVRLAAFGILFETALGVKIDEEEVNRKGLLKVNDEIAASVIARMVNIFHWPDVIYYRTKNAQEFKRNVEFIQAYNDRIVKTRKSEYKMGLAESESKKSFLDILLRMHMEEGSLTEDQVRDEVTSIFIGGFDTTATSISYTLYLLGHHPEVQAKLHEELDFIFGDDWERPVTVDDLKHLKYLDCVAKESMRLYPPVPLIARNIDEDVKVGEYTIPKGTVAIAAIYFMQRHPRFFPDPHSFIPERFSASKERTNPFAYVPFSGGARNCLGQRFANLEDKILLIHIMRRFEIKSKVPMTELQLSIEVVLRATQGLEIALTPRRRPSASR